MARTQNPALLAQAQAFVDRKYVVTADERQKSMGLGYVTAERTDLAREIASFTASIVNAQVAEAMALLGDVPGETLVDRVNRIVTDYLGLQVELEDRDRRINMLRKAIRVGDA
ncbi:hypothetical protein [Bradyrhizobium sp. LeoA1S1]